MLGTYASAALICAASLLVGRALLAVAGRDRWTWVEPAVGLGALITVAGALSRAPGRSTTAALGIGLLIAAALAIVLTRPRPRTAAALREGLPVALVTAAVLSIPFAISARWGIPGVGFNNDLGLHLAWAEWLRSDLGPAPFEGYPLGPHGLAAATAAVPGLHLGQAFVGEVFAISVITALTALGALAKLGPGRRLLAAVMVALPYLAASYFAQGAFKETAEALFVLAFAVSLRDPGGVPAGRLAPLRLALPYLALAGGVFFAYSFAGLAWPIAIVGLWALAVPAVRRWLAPRNLLRLLLRPATLIAVALLAGLAVVATVVGPFGFAGGFNKVAGSNTYGPVSPVESLGVWWASNYRLDAPGTAELPWLAGAIGALAVVAGLIWWLRRREIAVPVALAACALLYVVSLPFSGEYSQAKALMIGAPLAMLLAIRPLLSELPTRGRRHVRGAPATASGLAWSALAVVFIGGAAYSSFLALRDAPIGPPGHGAELAELRGKLKGKPVLYAGQDRFAAHELLGADAHVPLVEFPDEEIAPNPEKPFDTGDAYSPIDFDSFTYGTLERFPYVITGRAAWNSGAPPNFRRIAATPSFLLWERTGSHEQGRRVLVEGTDAAAWAGCESPEIRILLESAGRASLMPESVVAEKGRWDPRPPLGIGDSTSQTVRLPAGRWHLSLQYFSPFDLTLSAPGFRQEVKAALDGQRPNTISLANNGQFWPAGTLESDGGPVRLTIAAEEPSTLQRLSGYDGKAYVGNLVATRAEPHRTVALGAACDSWIDWYEAPSAP